MPKHFATDGSEHLRQRLMITGIVDIDVVCGVVEVRLEIEIGMKPPSWQPSMVWRHRSKPIWRDSIDDRGVRVR